MEIYILDDTLRRTEIVESYESMIWTQRYSAYGDFELRMDPSLAEAPLFVQGTRLACDKSNRVMVIDTVENTFKEDGTKTLIISGKSLESVLNERPNQRAFATAGAIAEKLTLTGLPAAIIRTLFDDICRINSVIPTDNIPYIQSGEISPGDTIPEPSDVVTILTEIDTLYNTIKNISDIYRLGFRLIRPAEDSKLYFEVYTGFNRTTSQTVNTAVVFSAELDNLTDTTELTSTALLKNVAYVFSPNGSRIVYAVGTDPSIAGFEKKVLIVNASDIDLVAGTPLNAALDQRGAEELAKTGVIIGFDGQIPSLISYVYGVDYKLGDIVEKRNDKGTTSQMRVTEQIFVSDAEGDKSYPTLTLDAVITAGSWDSIAGNKAWDDYTTQTWDSM